MAPGRRSTINLVGTPSVEQTPARSPPLQPRKTMSWSIFAQQASQNSEPRLHQQLFPKYQLSVDKLEAWLGRKFPDNVGKFGIQFRQDEYYFNIPRPLSEEDEAELREERDKPPANAPRSRSQSVE